MTKASKIAEVSVPFFFWNEYGKGLSLRAEPPRLKLFWEAPPPRPVWKASKMASCSNSSPCAIWNYLWLHFSASCKQTNCLQEKMASTITRFVVSWKTLAITQRSTDFSHPCPIHSTWVETSKVVDDTTYRKTGRNSPAVWSWMKAQWGQKILTDRHNPTTTRPQ